MRKLLVPVFAVILGGCGAAQHVPEALNRATHGARIVNELAGKALNVTTFACATLPEARFEPLASPLGQLAARCEDTQKALRDVMDKARDAESGLRTVEGLRQLADSALSQAYLLRSDIDEYFAAQ